MSVKLASKLISVYRPKKYTTPPVILATQEPPHEKDTPLTQLSKAIFAVGSAKQSGDAVRLAYAESWKKRLEEEIFGGEK